MAVGNSEPLAAGVVPAPRRSERVQAQLFATLLRRDIKTMQRKVVQAELTLRNRCEAADYVEPPERLVTVRERLAEARRMLGAWRIRTGRASAR